MSTPTLAAVGFRSADLHYLPYGELFGAPVEVARAGDFAVTASRRAARISMALSAFADPERTPPHRLPTEYDAETAELYRRLGVDADAGAGRRRRELPRSRSRAVGDRHAPARRASGVGPVSHHLLRESRPAVALCSGPEPGPGRTDGCAGQRCTERLPSRTMSLPRLRPWTLAVALGAFGTLGLTACSSRRRTPRRPRTWPARRTAREAARQRPRRPWRRAAVRPRRPLAGPSLLSPLPTALPPGRRAPRRPSRSPRALLPRRCRAPTSSPGPAQRPKRVTP